MKEPSFEIPAYKPIDHWIHASGVGAFAGLGAFLLTNYPIEWEYGPEELIITAAFFAFYSLAILGIPAVALNYLTRILNEANYPFRKYFIWHNAIHLAVVIAVSEGIILWMEFPALQIFAITCSGLLVWNIQFLLSYRKHKAK
jgi:hypothetical protein